MTTFTPNADQLAALKAFADLHGRYWKRDLRACWMSGWYGASQANRSGLLQQCRNQGGPDWLARFKFPEAS